MSGWLYEGQHGFRPGYSYESQVVTVCQDIADSLDEGVRTDAIITDFSKAFDLVPHDRLLTKIAATGVDLRAVVCVKEFLLGRLQRVRADGHLYKERTYICTHITYYRLCGVKLEGGARIFQNMGTVLIETRKK